MVLSDALWDTVVSHRGRVAVPLRVVAVSPTTRLAAECTEAGVTTCGLVARIRMLPGGMLVPHAAWARGATAEDGLPGERPVAARQVTVTGRGKVPPSCRWWLRRRANSALPLAFIFKELEEEIVLPDDAFGGEICALSVSGGA